jgi:hypothetical protein
MGGVCYPRYRPDPEENKLTKITDKVLSQNGEQNLSQNYKKYARIMDENLGIIGTKHKNLHFDILKFPNNSYTRSRTDSES